MLRSLLSTLLAIAAALASSWRVILALAGVLLIGVGIWMVYTPAALISIGLMLLLLAFRG